MHAKRIGRSLNAFALRQSVRLTRLPCGKACDDRLYFYPCRARRGDIFILLHRVGMVFYISFSFGKNIIKLLISQPIPKTTKIVSGYSAIKNF